MPVVSKNAAGAILEQATPSWPVETVAAANSAIGNAAALGSNVGLSIVTGADDTKCVLLPVAQPGKVLAVYSATATSGLPIFPQVNSTINGGSANSSVVIEGKSLALFIGTNSTNWAAIYTVNS